MYKRYKWSFRMFGSGTWLRVSALLKFWCVRKIAKSISGHLELGSHWTDFHEIWCFSEIYREYTSFIKMTRITDTWALYMNMNVHLITASFFERESFRQKLQRKSKQIFMFNNFFFLILQFITYTVEPDRPQMTMTCAFLAGYQRLNNTQHNIALPFFSI